MPSNNNENTSDRVEKTIQRLVASKSNDEAKQVYAEWQSYDEDLSKYGYVAPDIAVAKLSSRVKAETGPIYDAGCGSGKVGALLRERGFTEVHGSDLSESMLERAAALKVYASLKTADFTKALPEPDNQFKAVVSVGVWNDALANPLTAELLRITSPGGAVVFTVRPQFIDALEPIVAKFLKDGKIEDYDRSRDDYITGQKSEALYVSFRKT